MARVQPFSPLGFVYIERSFPSPVTNPPRAVHKSSISGKDELELRELDLPSDPNASRTQQADTISQTPPTPDTQAPWERDDVEMSRPASPQEPTGIVHSWSYPSMNKWRVLSCCLVYFGNGLNDAAPGAIIPYMETDYHIGYAIVSLIFVANAVGYILAAFFTNTILAKLGRAKSLMLSEIGIAAGYVMMVTAPPFGVVVAAFFIIGFATAINLALNNVFCANLADSTVILGYAHGSYGVGGTVGPIIATAMVSNGIVWSRFYLITLGLRVACFFFVGWAFWTYEQEDPNPLVSTLERTTSTVRGAEVNAERKGSLLKQALKTRTTIFGALFIFAYQGAEVSISGWMISFLINHRNGNPASVGYVTAGFWAGITLGRFFLSHAASRVGEKVFVSALTGASVIFQILVWFIPNVVGDAVAVSILGLLLGPIYPCAQTIFAKLLPGHTQTTAIGFIASAGSSGGAIAPFTTGILAQAVGTYVLHPVCIGMFAVMELCWFGLPKLRKRTE